MWIFCGIAQYKIHEISVTGYFVYILGGLNFAYLCLNTSQRDCGFFFWNNPLYKTNEIGLIGYFVYVLGEINFACLCHTSPGECGFFLE